MKKATQDLFDEHVSIMQGLQIMEEIGMRLHKHGKADYVDIIDLTDFLKEFADKCHHGKEEDFLIPAIRRSGIFTDEGPLGRILAEHDQGREYISEMHDSIIGSRVSSERFLKASRAYVELLREHIRKENTLLFPLVDSRFSDTEQHELYNEFRQFEEKVIGNGRHAELHSTLARLSDKYLTGSETSGHQEKVEDPQIA